MADGGRMTQPIRERTLDMDLRLECLRLCGGDVDFAKQAYAFVTGHSAATPRERILSALEDAGVR